MKEKNRTEECGDAKAPMRLGWRLPTGAHSGPGEGAEGRKEEAPETGRGAPTRGLFVCLLAFVLTRHSHSKRGRDALHKHKLDSPAAPAALTPEASISGSPCHP